MPEGHQQLIETVASANHQTVVVLTNGSAVIMPWVDQVPCVVEAWLGGQAGGSAIVDVLTGKVNPSGKLSETFPKRLEDCPAYLSWTGEQGKVHYREGLFIGYRHYDAKNITHFPIWPWALLHPVCIYNLRLSASELATNRKDYKSQLMLPIPAIGLAVRFMQLYVHPKQESARAS